MNCRWISLALFASAVTCTTLATSTPNCAKLFPEAGLSANYNETIGHAIHSMTVEGLRLFRPWAPEKNFVPTVNQDLSHGDLVLSHAPSDAPGEDFQTMTMNVIDKILSQLGNSKDGLGPNWSPVERVAHVFHMWDLWYKIRATTWPHVLANPPSDQVCTCLVSVEFNGIKKAVRWVAEHYKTGTPITLLDRPIPRLVDAGAWSTWKSRLLHYYTPKALTDAAQYLYCVSQFWNTTADDTTY